MLEIIRSRSGRFGALFFIFPLLSTIMKGLAEGKDLVETLVWAFGLLGTPWGGVFCIFIGCGAIYAAGENVSNAKRDEARIRGDAERTAYRELAGVIAFYGELKLVIEAERLWEIALEATNKYELSLAQFRKAGPSDWYSRGGWDVAVSWTHPIKQALQPVYELINSNATRPDIRLPAPFLASREYKMGDLHSPFPPGGVFDPQANEAFFARHEENIVDLRKELGSLKESISTRRALLEQKKLAFPNLRELNF